MWACVAKFQDSVHAFLSSLIFISYFHVLVYNPCVYSHIRLIEPSQRSSLWRNPDYAKFHPRINTKDDQIWCDYVLQPKVPQTCGVCGDPFTSPEPRDNEHGGIYGQGVIARSYTAGEEIRMSAYVSIPHNGTFHFQLCPEVPESNDCFMTGPKLEIKTGEGTFQDHPVVGTHNTPYWINGSLKLPSCVACTKCVLRLQYRAGYLGDCGNGTQDYGCGLQITFRNCVDISIFPEREHMPGNRSRAQVGGNNKGQIAASQNIIKSSGYLLLATMICTYLIGEYFTL